MRDLQQDLLSSLSRLLRSYGRYPRAASRTMQALRPLEHVGWDRNVVGVSLGTSEGGSPEMTLLVEKKVSTARLHPRRVAPEGVELKHYGKDLRIHVRETGGVRLHALAQPGVSIANSDDVEGGSAGYLVRFAGSDATLLLSCSHVLAGAAVVNPDSVNIEQPFSPAGHGDLVAVLRDFSKFSAIHDNLEDYAIAELLADAGRAPHVVGQDFAPGELVEWGTGDAPVRTGVRHFGARSGPSAGVIMRPSASIRVPNAPGTGGRSAVVSGLVEYSAVSTGGDSGAPVLLDDDSHRAAGIHVAGDLAGGMSYFFPLRPILARHSLQLVTN